MCGGKGLRLCGDFDLPKGLVPIAGRPILDHIVRLYARQGVRDVYLALGHGARAIRRAAEKFGGGGVRVHCLDTGRESATGERIRRAAKHLPDLFFLTYGDGLADVRLDRLLAAHLRGGRAATVTVVRPRTNFGLARLAGNRVLRFEEKPRIRGWVNGGFFVMTRRAVAEIRHGEVWERGPMERLARKGDLTAYRHKGYWRCLDTYKDAVEIDETAKAALRTKGRLPWD